MAKLPSKINADTPLEIIVSSAQADLLAAANWQRRVEPGGCGLLRATPWAKFEGERQPLWWVIAKRLGLVGPTDERANFRIVDVKQKHKGDLRTGHFTVERVKVARRKPTPIPPNLEAAIRVQMAGYTSARDVPELVKLFDHYRGLEVQEGRLATPARPVIDLIVSLINPANSKLTVTAVETGFYKRKSVAPVKETNQTDRWEWLDSSKLAGRPRDYMALMLELDEIAVTIPQLQQEIADMRLPTDAPRYMTISEYREPYLKYVRHLRVTNDAKTLEFSQMTVELGYETVANIERTIQRLLGYFGPADVEAVDEV